MKNKLFTTLILLSISFFAQAQIFKIYDIDSSKYPVITAKYVAFDDKGRQIHNFEQEDISIYENENKIEINNLTNSIPKKPTPLSIVLTIDVSASMTPKRMELAKKSAKTIVNLTPLEYSEIAITSFDHKNYLNTDFTKDEKKLNKTIDNIKAKDGGTDYNYGFTKKNAGALFIAKNGFYKRIVIFLTDGLSRGNKKEIIEYANNNDITVYCISVALNMPDILKDISEKTNGKYHSNLKDTDQSINIYTDILLKNQNSAFGTISWTATQKLSTENTNISITAKYKSNKIHGNTQYQTSDNMLVSLEAKHTKLSFNEVRINETKNKHILIKAINSDIKIENISSSNNEIFKIIVPQTLPFILKNGQSIQLKLSYKPKDLGWTSTKIIFETSIGNKILYASGGNPAVHSTFNDNLKITSPTNKNYLIANSETNISWLGVNPNDMTYFSLSTDNGKNYRKITNSTNLKTKWQVPNIDKQKCKLRAFAYIDIDKNILFDSIYFSRIKFNLNTKQFYLTNKTFDSLYIFSQEKKLIKTFIINNLSFIPTDFFISNDGNKVAFIFKNKVSVWNIKTEKLIFTFEQQYHVRNLLFSNNDSLLFTYSQGQNIIISDINKRKIVDTLKHDRNIYKIAVSPNEKFVACIDKQNTIFLWELSDSITCFEFKKKHNEKINKISFNNNSTQLLTASADKNAILWNVETGKIIKKFKHKNEVLQAKFCSDKNQITTVTTNNSIFLWDIDKKKKEKIGQHKMKISDLQFNEDYSEFVTVSINKDAKIWKTNKIQNNNITKIDVENNNPEKIYFTSENEILIINKDNSYELFNTLSNKKIANPFFVLERKEPGELINTFDKSSNFIDAVFSPNGTKILTTDYRFNASLWDISTGTEINNFAGFGESSKFSEDGKNIISINMKSIWIWKIGIGRSKISNEDLHDKKINSINYSPDCSKIISASNDKTIKIINIDKEKIIYSKNINEPVKLAKYSPDGSKIFALTDNNIYICDSILNILFKIPAKNTIEIKFSLDSKKILFSNNKQTFCYKINNKENIYTVQGKLIDVVAGEKKFATLNNKKELKFWDIENGKFLYQINEKNKIQDFSLDGNRYIATNGPFVVVNSFSYKKKKLYSLKTDWDFNSHENIFKTIFSPDGSKILTVNSNKIRVWYSPQILSYETEGNFSIVHQIPYVKNVNFDYQPFLNKLVSLPFDSFIVNQQGYPIIIKEIQIKNKNANCFTLESGEPPFTISQKDTGGCVFSFKSETVGEKIADLKIITSTDTIYTSIQAEAIPEPLNFINSEIDFGKIKPFTTKKIDTTIFQNNSTASLVITEIINTGPDTTQFVLNKNYDKQEIIPGSGLNFDISYNPTQRGHTNTKLNIYFKNYPNNPFELMLIGEGDAPRRIKYIGKCISKETKKGIQDSVFCYDFITGNLILDTVSSKTGEFTLLLPMDRKYIIISDSEGYMPESKIIDLKKLVLNEIINDTIIQKKIKHKQKTNITSISFKSGSTELPYDIMKELDHIARMMKNNPKIKIMITGHSDNQGTPQAKQTISKERAEKVKKYLLTQNINSERIITKGKGYKNPLSTINTEVEQSKNRRVEIEIIIN